MLGTGEGDIIEHMKGIEDQRDVQEHILPYLYEYCGLVEKSPDIATEVNEKESAANHKEVQSEAVFGAAVVHPAVYSGTVFWIL